MDAQPGAETHRRGRGRKGGGGRAAYRRVQTAGDAASPSAKSGGRSVHVVTDAAAASADKKEAAPFQSSLRSSLKDSLRSDAPAKKSDASDGGRQRPSGGRGSSPKPQKKELQAQTKGPRQVISLSSPSPQKGGGQTKRFVSSLTQSIDHGGDKSARQSREERGATAASNPQGSSLRRSNSREPVRRSNSREPRPWAAESHGSYRTTERGSGNRSVSRTRLTRKNSTDSVSSQRSDRSDRSHRSERYSEEYRSSLQDGPPPVRRLSSASSAQAPFKSSLAGSLANTKSSQDVRFQKERPASGTIGRSFGRPAQETTSRRSSLDAGASSLRRVNSSSPVGASAGKFNSQDTRLSGPPESQRSPSALGGLRKNAPIGDSISSKPQKSVSGQEKEDTPVKAPPAPAAVDEAERKRLADTLRERMEARKKERQGSSLAQMMKAPLSRKSSIEDERRRSPLGAKKELENDKSSAEKDARTREYYAKLDKENSERETARRAAPFKSSLTSSVETAPTRPQTSLLASNDSAPPRTLRASLQASLEARPARTLKTSLSAALEPSRSVMSRAKKLQYSLAELRRLMAFAFPRPADLPDMKIVEVTQVRDPSSVSKRSSGRLGAGYGIGRSIGGSIRKSERSGRGAISRNQGVSGGGRRERQGRGGRGSGRNSRGGGGGRGGRPPPPPLYDGPIEPLTVSENRWKPTKEKQLSALDKTLSNVKSLLNKLTREKFAKLTNELCAVEIDNFVLLRYVHSKSTEQGDG
ncbi:unnamed protein product [Phytophthora fragariaefolia]|uniref:Unnamed protein product n=1 Tax=Phytophthora fragariaefolia TaxID=1490495 RepID=A0A9W6U1F3_9STRA|nr:unnamed protein product [Phytophthora fragariaefolia]